MAYREAFASAEWLEVPPVEENRISSWHLFPIRLHTGRLRITRNQFIEELKTRGIGTSVHWRPLHMHPYYEENFGWRGDLLPVATATFDRIISLPLFPLMTESEFSIVVDAVRSIGKANGR